MNDFDLTGQFKLNWKQVGIISLGVAAAVGIGACVVATAGICAGVGLAAGVGLGVGIGGTTGGAAYMAGDGKKSWKEGVKWVGGGAIIGGGIVAAIGGSSIAIGSKFTQHALQRVAQRGGSRVHGLIAKNFGKALGPTRDNLGRWSYNFATKNTRVAVNSKGKITTYIRYTSKWWKF